MCDVVSFHMVHALSKPFAISLWRLIMPMCLLSRSLLRHSLHLITFAGKFAGCTIDRKQCLDFRRLVTGIWSNKEWVFRVYCFCLSTPADTSLLIAGGAIPDRKYKSSTLVGFRHPVTDRHTWFSHGSRFLSEVVLPVWSWIFSHVVVVVVCHDQVRCQIIQSPWMSR